jgi:hypothetical protein
MPVDDVRDFFESVEGEPSREFSDSLLVVLQDEYLRSTSDANREPVLTSSEADGPALHELVVEFEPRRPRRMLRSGLLVAIGAAAAAVIAIVVVTIPSDDPTVSIAGSVPRDGRTFAAAVEASGVLHSPSPDEVTQANSGVYLSGGPEVSAAGNSVSLLCNRPATASVCGTRWAYLTKTAGGDAHTGLLGEANPLTFGAHVLDDRYFVAFEGDAPDTPGPSKAWLIDSLTGKSGALTWRAQPTTVNSSAQALLANTPTGAAVPKVVDARDGTIRPLAMPDDVAASVVAQYDAGRVWAGTQLRGGQLGLAYTEDGGATWTDVALPEGAATRGEDLLIAVAADRVAVTSGWVPDRMPVYVSHDLGRSWTNAAPSADTGDANIAHLYVLADGRLALMASADAHPHDLFVSPDSDWTELDRTDLKNWSTIERMVARGR